MIRHDDMPRLKPISTAGPSGEPALLVDESASPEALYLEADSRLTAVQGMLFSVATGAYIRSLDGQDVANIAQAAQILTSDAMDLLHALHSAHLRDAKRLSRPETTEEIDHARRR